MIGALLASLTLVAIYVWQDGLMDCNDGVRYTSHAPQPPPFHRRWCGWPKRVLQVTSLVTLVALGTLMGSWDRAILLLALPGGWFAATHPTTVDAPSMLLAWLAAMLMPTQPYAAVLLSCVAGFIHERGPVFAAIYAWHPLLLVGLVAVGWWRKPAGRDGDELVGGGFLEQIRVHRPYQDLLDARALFWTLRALPPAALAFGCSPRAWVSMGVAFASRIAGTDTGRFMFWAAPIVVADIGPLPAWVVAAHVLTFRRAI